MPKWQTGRNSDAREWCYRRFHFTKADIAALVGEMFRGWIKDSRHNLWLRRLNRDEFPVWVAKIKTAKGIRRFVLGPVSAIPPKEARGLLREFEYWYEDPAKYNKKEKRWAEQEREEYERYHTESGHWLPPRGERCPRCNNRSGCHIVPNQYKTNGWGCLHCYYKFRFERLANFRIRTNQARVLMLRETISEKRKTGI
jgi:hypothetical protein